MPFTFNNYATSELSKNPLNDIISNLFGGYEQGVKASYLQPSLAEELKKAKLVNQYYAPDIESQIGLRKAQTGESGARTGLIGEQTKGARIENQYLPEYKKAQIQQLQAGAEKARLLQMIREQLMGGGMQGGQLPQSSSPLMQMYQGQGLPGQQEQFQQQQQLQQLQQMQQQQPQMGNMPSYAQAAIAGQALGLGMPKIIEANGKYIALSPFGAIDTGVHGLNEQQKVLAKEDAKKIAKLEDIVLSGAQKTDTFNQLNADLGSQEFEAIRRNPILGRHEIGWYEKFGTPEQQQMIGRVKTHMGNIIKDSARDFAGQFRIGEQALLNDMKPNVSDSLDVMKGKSEALTYLNTIMSKRAELEADFMRNYGMNALQAKIAADKQIHPSEIKKEIATILHPASSRKGNYSQSDLEFTAKKHGMTIEQVRQKLEGR